MTQKENDKCKTKKAGSYDALDSVLQLYGSNQRRWPKDSVLDLSDFIKTDEEAKQRVRDYEAFEMCLDKGAEQVVEQDKTDLKLRIMSSLQASIQDDRVDSPSKGALESDLAKPLKETERGQKPFTDKALSLLPFLKQAALNNAVLRNRGMTERRFATASLFAASLILGLIIGLTLTSSSFLEQGIQVAFLDNGIVLEQSLEDMLLGADVL